MGGVGAQWLRGGIRASGACQRRTTGGLCLQSVAAARLRALCVSSPGSVCAACQPAACALASLAHVLVHCVQTVGIAEFSSREDLDRALTKLNGSRFT